MIWIDTLVQGILLGGLYALFAAGLSLVFGIMRLVNLAHGDLIVFAAYLILVGVQVLGLSPWVSALVAMPLMFGFGWLLQTVVLNRVLGRTGCWRAFQPTASAFPPARWKGRPSISGWSPWA